jgi:hypothetical protein
MGDLLLGRRVNVTRLGRRLLAAAAPAVNSTHRRRAEAVFLSPQRQNGLTIFMSQRDETRGAASMLRERSIIFHPEELSLLGHIFDQAMESLPAAMRTPHTRTEIARNILARAAAGERDPIQLELAATIDLKVSTAA